MLHIDIPDAELYDEINNEFKIRKGSSIIMEHSLLSLSKWESHWHKPFLTEENKTFEEIIDYYKCMTITQNVNPDVYYNVNSEIAKQIDEYINDPMTASTIRDWPSSSKDSGEFITSEIIYYWMISLGIPFECQKWHLNRLLMLIRVVSAKNAPAKKIPRGELLERQRRLNAERRAKFKTSG